MGRTGEATFTVIFGGTSSQQAIAFARRVQDQIEKAQITYRDQVLKMRASFGLAALDIDPVGSLEELMKLALQRLHQAASRAAQRIVGRDEVNLVKPATLPSDLERAVQAFEGASAEQLGDAAAGEALRRILPFLLAVCRRLNIEFPADKIAQALKDREK